jgi:uncharacterized protein (UPF0332 family)
LPTKPEHISKAERNEKFAETVSKTAYLDWAVTIIFYAALHYVDAILAVSGIHPDNHTQRDAAIGTNETLRIVRPEYRLLETVSQNARYRAMKIEAADLAEAQKNFTTLRAHLRGRMKLPD